MELVNLWIGDRLLIKSTGLIGVFEGAVNGQAKIRMGEKIILIPQEDLEIAPEVEEPNAADLLSPTETSDEELVRNPHDEIDLHIKKLNPSMEHSRAEHILQYQRKKCEEFIKDKIKRRAHRAIIIHGKGAGVLKSEVKHLIRKYPEIKFTSTIHDGGAVELYFL